MTLRVLDEMLAITFRHQFVHELDHSRPVDKQKEIRRKSKYCEVVSSNAVER